ncbi:hypothetical protein K239x_50940 [Planctomycetes bacterium K23_9]|uniref:Uncharacterized protein n=1 Tax=Stieleria marina TaxID=1930275 RepID=A0A517P128_9BACT|nr:hypothetical protein K239x_50940 [Planctomycetes bacterium K23_9]
MRVESRLIGELVPMMASLMDGLGDSEGVVTRATMEMRLKRIQFAAEFDSEKSHKASFLTSPPIRVLFRFLMPYTYAREVEREHITQQAYEQMQALRERRQMEQRKLEEGIKSKRTTRKTRIRRKSS